MPENPILDVWFAQCTFLRLSRCIRLGLPHKHTNAHAIRVSRSAPRRGKTAATKTLDCFQMHPTRAKLITLRVLVFGGWCVLLLIRSCFILYIRGLSLVHQTESDCIASNVVIAVLVPKEGAITPRVREFPQKYCAAVELAKNAMRGYLFNCELECGSESEFHFGIVAKIVEIYSYM